MILSELSRVMSGSVGGSFLLSSPAVVDEDFRVFDLFSLRLFSAANATILSISAALVVTLAAGITRYVLSANLMNGLSVLSGLRSPAVNA